MKEIDVVSGPAEFERLEGLSMPGTLCVVFDILRATTTLVAALSNGAEAILPVATIEEALEVAARDGNVLLAGEREGLRIGPELTGGRAFEFGNSPREFAPEKVRGRSIVMTTTNGTRALKSCRGAESVVAGGFVNLSALVEFATGSKADRVLLVCSGTGQGLALEDTLAAGAFCARWPSEAAWGDAAWLVRDAWRATGETGDLAAWVRRARNARRLAAIPELSADIECCLALDASRLVPKVGADGWLRRVRE